MACLLICLGIVLFLAGIIVCAAVSCEPSTISLFPIGIQVFIAGLLLLHCGWASQLLDEERLRLGPFAGSSAQAPPDAEAGPDGPDSNRPEDEWEVKVPEKTRPGYWQFVDKEAWQIVSSRDKLY